MSEGLHIQQASTGYQGPCRCNISWFRPIGSCSMMHTQNTHKTMWSWR